MLAACEGNRKFNTALELDSCKFKAVKATESSRQFQSHLLHKINVPRSPQGGGDQFYVGDRVKEILLTQGKVAVVDDEDFEWLNQWRWHTSNGYAIAMINGKTVRMHRLILGLTSGSKYQTDHINNNRLDNRRCNLRPATASQNNANKRKVSGISKYKGVSWCPRLKNWRGKIKVNQKHIFLGYFNNEIEAAAAYDLAALKYFGEFALTNFEIAMVA